MSREKIFLVYEVAQWLVSKLYLLVLILWGYDVLAKRSKVYLWLPKVALVLGIFSAAELIMLTYMNLWQLILSLAVWFLGALLMSAWSREGRDH